MKKIFLAGFVFLFFPLVALADTDHLVISQVQTTGGAGKTANDLIEIYNPTSTDIDLKGMRLVKRTKTGTSDTSLKSWTDSAIVPAHGFYLWANSDFSDISTTPDATTSGTIADDNGVALRLGSDDTGTIIDSVGWGSAANLFVETNAFAANPSANQSLERLPGSDLGNGTDTGNNAADFFLQTAVHPRNLQSPVVPPILVEPPPAPPPPPPPTDDSADEETPQEEEEITPPPPPPPPPTFSSDILISEFMPNPDGADSGAEWVELYNNSIADVDLSDWMFDDESANDSIGSSAYKIPAGTSIMARSFLVITLADGAFALDNTGGDSLRLFWPDKTLFKHVSFSENAKTDEAYAFQDGIYFWTQFPTKGAANQFDQIIESGIKAAAQTSIKINEIFPNPEGPDSGAEWVEVLNTGKEPVHLHNWILDDGVAGSKIGSSSYKIQSLTVMPAGLAVLAIPAGKFSLDNTSDTVRLFNENNVLIDSVEYDAASENSSYALTDGIWVWGKPTPNAANIAQAELIQEEPAASVVISEIFPEPARKSGQEEFIELFNPGVVDVDLAGFKLADAASEYKLEAVIPPGSYLVILKSESNISLNNTGKETVSLTDPNEVILASVEYEDAPADQSYNLDPDGTYAWSAKLTPGATNQIVKVPIKVQPAKKKKSSQKITTPAPDVPAQEDFQQDFSGIVNGENYAAVSPASFTERMQSHSNSEWFWILASSFALNLFFCYILIKLMLRKGKYESR